MELSHKLNSQQFERFSNLIHSQRQNRFELIEQGFSLNSLKVLT
jgi:hypothetical protein